jgi:type VI secretion system secreted protein VgrG
VRLTAQGAFLKLEGGNIMLHGPGKIEFKASMKQLSGPQAAYFVPPKLPFGEIKPTKLILERLYHDNEPLAGAPFQVTFADGSIQKGRLDGAGRSVLDDVPPGAASVFFGPMPGKFERKDQEPMPSYNPAPCEKDIDALLDKYWISEEPRK